MRITATASDVGVSQPAVSHHPKKLREAGLLNSERRFPVIGAVFTRRAGPQSR